MLLFLALGACDSDATDPADSGACPTGESEWGCLSVAHGTATCPDPASVSPGDLDDPWDCNETVVAILSEEAPAPNECSYLLNCDAQCCYDVATVSCTDEICPQI